MIIALINSSDLHYNSFLEVDIDLKEEDPQELLDEFEKAVKDDSSKGLVYAPEHFIYFLRKRGLEARSLSSLEVCQLHWKG